MTNSLIHIVCASCSTKNRLAKTKLTDKPICGKCGKAVLSSSPVLANDKNFSRFITDNDLPVVVDFWLRGVARVNNLRLLLSRLLRICIHKLVL